MSELDRFWSLPPGGRVSARTGGATLRRVELDDGGWPAAPVHLPVAEPASGEPLVTARVDGGDVVLAARREDGNIELAFDPEQAVARLTGERAMTPAPPLSARLPFSYNRLPAPVRRVARDLLVRRRSGGGEHDGFPAWPADGSVEAARLLYLRARTAAEPGLEPAPFWPDGKRFALVLTHDVDTAAGLGRAPALAGEVASRGLPSCWFLVGEGYPIDDGAVDAIRDAGGEIGLHDALHDNRIAFMTPAEIAGRLDRCRPLIERHAIRGFRSPSMLRTEALYGALRERFAYDSSIPDVGLLPQRNGCATVFPLEVCGMPVLPLTVPPDGQLISRGLDPDGIVGAWIEKVEYVRSIGGAAVVLTHPEDGFLETRGVLDAYRTFLDWCAAQDDAWHATPGQVMEHWRSRGAAAPVSP